MSYCDGGKVLNVENTTEIYVERMYSVSSRLIFVTYLSIFTIFIGLLTLTEANKITAGREIKHFMATIKFILTIKSLWF